MTQANLFRWFIFRKDTTTATTTKAPVLYHDEDPVEQKFCEAEGGEEEKRTDDECVRVPAQADPVDKDDSGHPQEGGEEEEMEQDEEIELPEKESNQKKQEATLSKTEEADSARKGTYKDLIVSDHAA